ncbi:MAG: DUF455 family protein [Oligoflexales bacterium]|nr:DUF455 family protein [Oligoflexales bacterium]
MELYEYARMILFGADLDEKLIRPAAFSDTRPGKENLIPANPRRSPLISLSKNYKSKTKFPGKSSLSIPENRGRVLHFFANHELLALELMALVLLRFPKAPKKFRLGIAQTMLEEQEHLALYLTRMNQLGVGFGEEHLNDFFWKCIANVRSPLEFTAKMSLTLEQGNLDFSYYYWQLFQKLGDQTTAAILKRVYEDEIGHVKHGLHWFRSFKNQDGLAGKSDWDIYRGFLEKPLSPIRAKGLIFVEKARMAAGLDTEFIQQVKHYQGSKGRPPSIWIFNPNFEEELVFPKKTFPKTKALTKDLSHLLTCLANEHDIIVTQNPPPKQFLMELKKVGFKVPKFLCEKEVLAWEGSISRIKPWGWSHKIFQYWSRKFHNLTDEHPQDKEWLSSKQFEKIPLKNLTSKAFASEVQTEFLDSLSNDQKAYLHASAYPAYIATNLEEFSLAYTQLAQLSDKVLIKAPYGSSGRHQRKLDYLGPIPANDMNWIKNTLRHQSKLVIEPYLDKVVDLSVQLMIHSDESASVQGVTRFLTHNNRSYFGHVLGQKLFACDSEVVRAIHQKPKYGLSNWELLKKSALFVIKKLQAAGYTGPAGIDAFIFKQGKQFYLRPLVEINCRYTMGHCALALERFIPKDWLGLFSIKVTPNKCPTH